MFIYTIQWNPNRNPQMYSQVKNSLSSFDTDLSNFNAATRASHNTNTVSQLYFVGIKLWTWAKIFILIAYCCKMHVFFVFYTSTIKSLDAWLSVILLI